MLALLRHRGPEAIEQCAQGVHRVESSRLDLHHFLRSLEEPQHVRDLVAMPLCQLGDGRRLGSRRGEIAEYRLRQLVLGTGELSGEAGLPDQSSIAGELVSGDELVKGVIE